MRYRLLWAALLPSLLCACGAAPEPAGLVRAASVLPPNRPLGVNLPFLVPYYFDPPPLDASEARRQLDLAAQRGLTHARFFATQYWPSQMVDPASGWLSNPGAYFARIDQLFADARSRGIRLIPCLIQNSYLFSDLAGEPRGQLFVRGSQTRRLAEKYITDFVTRYRSDDTVLFWEIANELNLGADIDSTCTSGDSACSCDYAFAYPSGRCVRGAADDYAACHACSRVSSSQQDLGQLTADIGTLIHTLDPTRSISSGDSVMRGSAYHLATQAGFPSWSGYPNVADTQAQYAQMVAYLHPSPVDIVSMHPYRGTELALFGDYDLAGLPLIINTQVLAQELHKKLYVGEFGEINGGTFTCGSQSSACGGDATKQATRRMIDSMVASDVAYAGLWSYESSLDDECPLAPGCYDVVDDDPVISYMAMRNQDYGACLQKANGTPCAGGYCRNQLCQPAPFTPPVATPVTLRQWRFDSASALAGWTTYTSCTGCSPGIFSYDGWSPPTAQATTFSLPCSGTCMFPGLYVSSPQFPVTPGGTLTLYFAGFTSTRNAAVWLFVRDADEHDVAARGAALPQGSFYGNQGPGGTTFSIPATAQSAFVQIKVLDPNATVNLSSVKVEEQ